ncbi:MAG TPA: rhomboid family protein [Verrucomicrobiae bacterium]|nr:rhomboid family protein [Verrucomicrobiae bacterium]
MNFELTHQRCFNHASREAVARCPECKQFFCRECISEHDDRVLCSACLKKMTRPPLIRRFSFTQIRRFAQFIFSFFLAWYFFFLIGEALLRLPDSFHQGTIWHVHWIDNE